MLTTERVGIANVTFEPGCRNNWYIHHEGGQILLCTAGRGYYQEWGRPVQELKPAAGSSNEWLEPVEEQIYSKLK